MIWNDSIRLKVTILSLFQMVVFLLSYGISMHFIFCILLCEILIFASMSDMATHTIPHWTYGAIMLVGLIGFSPLPALVGMLVTGLPIFITSCVTNGRMAGGDVKLVGAIGFAVGAKLGVTALIIGLFLAVVFEYYFIVTKRKSTNEPFAVVPYLSVGCFLALL